MFRGNQNRKWDVLPPNVLQFSNTFSTLPLPGRQALYSLGFWQHLYFGRSPTIWPTFHLVHTCPKALAVKTVMFYYIPIHWCSDRNLRPALLCTYTSLSVLSHQLSILGTAVDPSYSSDRRRAVYVCTGDTPENQLQWSWGAAQGLSGRSGRSWKTNR